MPRDSHAENHVHESQSQTEAADRPDKSLRKSSYRAISSYFAERPIVSEPWYKTHPSLSRPVPRNNHGFFFFVVFGIISALFCITTLPNMSQDLLAPWLEHAFWAAFGAGAIWVYWRADD